MPTIQSHTIIDFGQAIFAAAGAPDDIARTVSESLVKTNLMGHDSHGIIRVNQYVNQIRKGTLQPAARAVRERGMGAIAIADCQWGFGQIGARFGTELAGELAAEHGIGAVALSRVNHIGRLGEYADMLARQGQIGIVFTSGTIVTRSLTPWGGREPILGTNPMAWAVPTGDEPLLLDFATAAVANGKIVVAMSKGEPFPEGMLLDKHGKPTTNPADFFDGGMLLPFGTYKGSGLAIMIEIIPTLLAGFAPVTSPEFHPGNPTLIMALQVEAFTDLERFERLTRELMARVKIVPPAANFDEVLLPGDKEARSMVERTRDGIPLPAKVWQDLTALAMELGAAVPDIEGA
jgi:LDH2 family malate/lactate/ureidoglycolate dehydrogenase